MKMEDRRDVAARIEQLPDFAFDIPAAYTAMMIDRHGFCFTALTPGDSTKYEISIISPPTNWQHERFHFFQREALTKGAMTFQERFSGSYWVATQFGPLYRWEGDEVHPDYVWEKMTGRNKGTDIWTAHVLARFLNELAPLLPAKPERQEARID